MHFVLALENVRKTRDLTGFEGRKGNMGNHMQQRFLAGLQLAVIYDWNLKGLGTQYI